MEYNPCSISYSTKLDENFLLRLFSSFVPYLVKLKLSGESSPEGVSLAQVLFVSGVEIVLALILVSIVQSTTCTHFDYLFLSSSDLCHNLHKKCSHVIHESHT